MYSARHLIITIDDDILCDCVQLNELTNAGRLPIR